MSEVKEYGANSIDFLKGLETVRTRPRYVCWSCEWKSI
jgi:DNA gyrase/topoisomerase IV subunit B